MEAGERGLQHDELAQKVFDALSLDFDLYAADPDVRFRAREETNAAFREVLAYRLYQDLRRGWRITSPNLEQCGLLEIRYKSLPELCAAEEEWQHAHPALADASPETREKVAKVLLDHMRRELAIKVDYLESEHQERIKHPFSSHGLDSEEITVAIASSPPGADSANISAGAKHSPSSQEGWTLRKRGRSSGSCSRYSV